jgi:hypothetical protein
MPAAASALMSASKMSPTSSVKASGPGSIRSALVRNAAIWPRVTGSSGQNRRSAHPRVIPRVLMRCISSAKIESPVSSKTAPAGAGGAASVRVRKAAICPRVIGSSGQNRSGGAHPLVMPAAKIASIAPSWTSPSSSKKDPPGARAGCAATPGGAGAAADPATTATTTTSRATVDRLTVGASGRSPNPAGRRRRGS